MIRQSRYLFACLFLATGCSALFAGKPIYMNYGDVRSEITSIDFGGLSPRDISTGQASGKRQHNPIVIVKSIDKASPLLAKAATKGELLPAVTIEFTRPGADEREQVYMVVTLHDVMISSIHTGASSSSSGHTGQGSTGTSSRSSMSTGQSRSSSAGGSSSSSTQTTNLHISGSGGDRPSESLSLNFTKIEYKRLDGKTTAMDDWKQ